MLRCVGRRPIPGGRQRLLVVQLFARARALNAALRAAIIATRKLLIEATRDVAEGGTPRGADTTSYYNLRAIEKVFDAAVPWRDVLLPEMYPKEQPEPAG